MHAAIILVVSYFTIFRNYQEPASFFWDENYHIAAAQKYLNGVFFMEPHPPLGKLLIAAGEYLLSPNSKTDQFLQTDHAPTSPAGFSFAGYRFFPVLLATLCPLLLFLIVATFASDLLALFIALLFALDNALIVHLRGAMLEGSQMFFILIFLLALAVFVKQLITEPVRQNKNNSWIALVLGTSLGAVLTTKLNGIILVIPLLPVLLILAKQRQLTKFFALLTFSFLAVFFLVWTIHISLGVKIEPKLPDSGYYQASIPYRIALQNNSGSSLSYFTKLYDNFAFLPHYTKGVPELNYCKRDENGSPWYWWLVGGKSISYRWDKTDGLTHFLYLVVNPVGWALSLIGVVLGAILFGSGLFFNTKISKKSFFIIATLFISWASYIAVFGSLGRVMYLYHYFIPLLLGWIMLAFTAPQISHFGSWKIKLLHKKLLLVFMCIAEVSSFAYFSPFTYGTGISDEGIKNRNWLSVWDIRCTSCSSGNPLAQPIGDPKRSFTSDLSVSGLRAAETYQEWGEPVMDRTVTREPLVFMGQTYKSGLGVHATSRVVFDTNKRFNRFSAKVGLPDYLKAKTGGSVVFKIFGDGNQLWASSKVSSGSEPVEVDIGIVGVSRIILEATDAGDGNTDDHAVWIEPKFW